MSAAEVGFGVSVFLACAVEAVEALTIVLAVGHSRSWPSALSGALAATLLLAVAIAALGGAITSVPVGTLRLVLGVVLLALGAQWLRKAVLRAAGLKALHDEQASYEEEIAEARAARSAQGSWDRYAFLVAAQGVFVEGFEVALIVVAFGASRGRLGLAAASAALAVAVVIAAGFAVGAPLARVPENTMKFTVGVALCAFGVFWFGEGAGLSWPGGDAILLALLAAVLCFALASVRTLRRRSAP